MLPFNIPKNILKIVGLFVLLIALIVPYYLYKVGRNEGYAPKQPIPFSHKIHAGINNIPCLYCHSNADNSKHATVPGMNVCMNCHTAVKTESPLIKEVQKYYNDNKPIEWVKVNDIQDHVYFSHKRHVTKGIDCQVCHGDVAKMDTVKQQESLLMGFCVSCHKDPKAKLGDLPGIPDKAPLECSTCHQ